MIRRRCLMISALLLAIAGTAFADDAPTTVTVKIENFTFTPAELVVKPGTTVTWENADDIPHSVVDNDAKFKSKPLDTGDKFTMTFTDPGEVNYFCGFHPHMVGRILVKP
jgi:plastocyanin